MCLIAHIASRSALTGVAWDDAAPSLHVKPLADPYRPVTAVFSNPHVSSVGSYEEGCACYFRNVWRNDENDSPELELTPDEFGHLEPESIAVTESTAALVALLQTVAIRDGGAEVYAFWDGDQDLPPIDTVRLHLAELSPETFLLVERRLLVIEGHVA